MGRLFSWLGLTSAPHMNPPRGPIPLTVVQSNAKPSRWNRALKTQMDQPQHGYFGGNEPAWVLPGAGRTRKHAFLIHLQSKEILREDKPLSINYWSREKGARDCQTGSWQSSLLLPTLSLFTSLLELKRNFGNKFSCRGRARQGAPGLPAPPPAFPPLPRVSQSPSFRPPDSTFQKFTGGLTTILMGWGQRRKLLGSVLRSGTAC